MPITYKKSSKKSIHHSRSKMNHKKSKSSKKSKTSKKSKSRKH